MAAASPIVDVDSTKIAHAISSALVILKKKKRSTQDLREMDRHLGMLNWNLVALSSQTLATETTLATLRSRPEIMAAVPSDMIKAGRRKVAASRNKVATSLRQLRAAHKAATSFPDPIGARLVSAVSDAIEGLVAFAAMVDRTGQQFDLELDSRHADQLVRDPPATWVPWEQARKSFGL